MKEMDEQLPPLTHVLVLESQVWGVVLKCGSTVIRRTVCGVCEGDG